MWHSRTPHCASLPTACTHAVSTADLFSRFTRVPPQSIYSNFKTILGDFNRLQGETNPILANFSLKFQYSTPAHAVSPPPFTNCNLNFREESVFRLYYDNTVVNRPTESRNLKYSETPPSIDYGEYRKRDT